MNPSYNIIIPARYGSSRFPGKPLVDINGKTMLQHTYERALIAGADRVIIATDDQRIFDSVLKYTDQVMMTSSEHQTGTDRLAEVVKHYQWSDDTIVVNVQGDEPLILSEHIDAVVEALVKASDAGIATLRYKIQNLKELFDKNVVKVVCDINDYALYFSRAVIPWNRDEFSHDQLVKNEQLIQQTPYYRHIGMYAYRVGTLKQFPTLLPTMIEQVESLEQLRALYNGIRIVVPETDKQPGHGVDVPEDLEYIKAYL